MPVETGDKLLLFLLLAQIFPHQDLEQLVPVDLANHGPGVVVVGNIGGVLGQDIAHDLIDGIIALLFQGLVNRGENLMNFLVLFQGKAELSGEIVHRYTTFLSTLLLVYSIFGGL